MRAALMFGTILVVAACGGKEKAAPAADSTAVSAPPQAAMMPDSMMMPTTDSSRRVKAKIDLKAPGPLRDSAFGPKFAVDSTGKVVPIKPPPKR